MIKWNYKRPSGTRISRKALHGVAVRLLVYVVEISILMLSLPRKIPVRENQVSGSTEKAFGNDSICVDQSAQPSRIPAFLRKWCATDNIEMHGFTVTAVRLVCMQAIHEDWAMAEGKKIFYGLSKSIRSNQRVSNRSEEYILYYRKADKGFYVFPITGNSGMYFQYSHTMTYFTTFGSNEVETISFAAPQNIHNQAANIASRLKFLRCQDIGGTSHARVITCELSSDSPLGPFLLPYSLLGFIETKRAARSAMKLVSLTGIFDDTDVILGEVNRPRLCVLPALILLTILAVLSILSRKWKPGSNVTLQLWKWFSTTLNSSNSENPMFVSRERQKSKLNVLNVGPSASDAPLIVLAMLVIFSVVSRIWISGGSVTQQLCKWANSMLKSDSDENAITASLQDRSFSDSGGTSECESHATE